MDTDSMEPMYIEVLYTDTPYFVKYYVSPYTKSYVIFDNVTKHILQLRNLTRNHYFVSLYTNDDRVVHYKDTIKFETNRLAVKGVVRNVLYHPNTIYNVELPSNNENEDDTGECIFITNYEYDEYCKNMMLCMELMNSYTTEKYENDFISLDLMSDIFRLVDETKEFDSNLKMFAFQKNYLQKTRNKFSYYSTFLIVYIIIAIICTKYFLL